MSAQVWRVGIEATHGGNPASPDTTQEGDIAIDDVRLLWPSCESTLLASHKSHVPYMYTCILGALHNVSIVTVGLFSCGGECENTLVVDLDKAYILIHDGTHDCAHEPPRSIID